MPETIEMTPTFEYAVKMALMVIEDGTEKGKHLGREELLRYGRMLDAFKAGLNQIHGETRDPATIAMVNAIARRVNNA